MTSVTTPPDMTLSEASEGHLLTRGGVELRVRPVAESDVDIVDRFFNGLTADDMMFRFLSGQPHLSSAQLAAMVGVDHRHREHLLAFDVETGKLVASLLIAADEAFVSAEVAIAIAPAYKTRGVGWTLLHHAIELARSRGLKTLRSIESRANRGAMEVERTLGFRASNYDGDATLALLELDLTQPG
ncbi:GNAT family N-acetyltransferase [Sphingopyxis sp. YF1]|uniref:GNAT family N-acetyltransferase n=1 Tax=Sphingopyxis sp. YF1 TaxID=2482763 RepID=UPI001F60D4B3|nr:GNAT family N-acetyltransferase [Sphingopyxis sp. YF1]UNU44729.1 GNAT family N-acetyltransferase [Sphingopyxis sp. YF1]